MKTILTFLIILVTHLPYEPTPVTDTFEQISLTPLYYGEESTFVISTRALKGTVRFYISNDLYNSREIARINFNGRGEHFVKYDNCYTRSTNRVQIAYIYDNETYRSPEVEMIPQNPTYRTLLNNETFESKGEAKTYKFKASSWKSTKLTYSFVNFDGLYMPDYYHKIRLEDFQIHMQSDLRGVFSCNPSLVINNYNGVFNDVALGNSVEFQLTAVRIKDGYAFKLKDTLYVHKETLMMSSTQKEGYVQTKHIYFPRNEMLQQSKYKAYFAIQNFGIDNDFVKHNFDLRPMKNIIGDCHNSEYCISRIPV